MAKLTLVRGTPGSGKSTLAMKLSKIGDVVIESDDFFMISGKYNFDATKLGEAHNWCQSTARFWLFRDNNVFVANTSIYMRDINCYWNISQKYGAEFEIVNCEGNWKNVHDVPENVLAKMRKNWKVVTTEEWVKHIKIRDDEKTYEYF